MADIINNIESTSNDQRYKNLYKTIADILDRRAIPTMANTKQFNNDTFKALAESSKKHQIIDFNHIHYTVNLLRSIIQGKSIFEDSYFKNDIKRYHDNYMIILQDDIDADISYINDLNKKTDKVSTTNHGCKALCVGFCSSHCYSGCKGCQGTCTGCNTTCSGGSTAQTG